MEQGGSDGKEGISLNTSKQSQIWALIFITWRVYYTWVSLLLKKKKSCSKKNRDEKMQLIFSHKTDFHSNVELTQYFHETKEHTLALRSDKLRKNQNG